jgi:LysM repeat protein
MRLRWISFPSAALCVALTASCSTTPGTTASSQPGGTGPFDARGNYVEAWADSPGKWRKGSTEIVEAEPDRAPSTTIPVLPPPVLAANETPRPVETTTTIVYKKPKPDDDTPTKSKTTARNSTRDRDDDDGDRKPKAKTTSKSTASNSTKPKSKAVVVKPKTTPKAVVKTKESSSRHTVRAGDNLYNIAKRYGTTVGAVQKANGMSGAMIKPGQTLKIPK